MARLVFRTLLPLVLLGHLPAARLGAIQPIVLDTADQVVGSVVDVDRGAPPASEQFFTAVLDVDGRPVPLELADSDPSGPWLPEGRFEGTDPVLAFFLSPDCSGTAYLEAEGTDVLPRSAPVNADTLVLFVPTDSAPAPITTQSVLSPGTGNCSGETRNIQAVAATRYDTGFAPPYRIGLAPAPPASLPVTSVPAVGPLGLLTLASGLALGGLLLIARLGG